MQTRKLFSFSMNSIQLTGVFYVDRLYTERHAHKLHKHTNELELLYVYGGEGRYQVGSREYVVHPGDMVICNANTLHGETLALKNTIQTYCCALTGLQIEGLPANCLLPSEWRPVVTLSRFQETIHSVLPNIYDSFILKEEEYKLARQLALGVLNMTCWEIHSQEKVIYTPTMQKIEFLVRDITEFIDQHFTEDLRMEDIGQALHISTSYLSHVFKRETGMSPKQYIILRRIGEAQSLLEATDIPIGEIEERLGFGSSVHFTATFKKYVGISPRDFRKGRRRDSHQ